MRVILNASPLQVRLTKLKYILIQILPNVQSTFSKFLVNFQIPYIFIQMHFNGTKMLVKHH